MAPAADDPSAHIARILSGYETAADDFVARTAGLPEGCPRDFLNRLVGSLSKPVLDVGAGAARDTRRLAQWSHAVTAVEPVPSLHRAGKQRCGTLPVRWADAALPTLRTRDSSLRPSSYRVIVVNGVWHHVPPEARETALRRLSQLLAPRGRLILSIRHGPTPAARPGFPVNRLSTLCMAGRHGLAPRSTHERPSLQAANLRLGVSWTWLVLERLSPPGRSSRRSRQPRRAGR
ncbi:MAG: class I SAM-dependent methyltransferase [Cohaesibacteraceae bacterium]